MHCQIGGALREKRSLTVGRDVELILRFFALLDHAHYEKPMKDFLSRFMKKNAVLNDTVREQFTRLFAETCKAVKDSLGPKPFHIRRGLNSAVFDCVMVSFAHHLASNTKKY
jgi:hypothetical protein